MSALSHQSAINPDKDFWIKATPGISSATQFLPNPVPYLEKQIWEQNTTNPTTVTALSGNLATYTDAGCLFYANDSIIEPAVTINVDATEQNFVPGVNVSTLAYAGAGFYSGGLGDGGNAMVRQQRDTNNTLYAQWQDRTPQNNSTMNLVYLNSSPLPINGNVINYDPTVGTTGEVRIPFWNFSTSQMNVSSINGAVVPANNALIDIPQPVLNNGTYVQQVSAIGTVAIPGLVPNGIYQYDVGVDVSNLVANNAGNAPVFPFPVFFGVRLGGTGATFDYGYTVPILLPGGSEANAFVLSGITKAGTTNNNLDVVIFFTQTGTTVTATFQVGGDPRCYLKQLA
jgi:hypothetical protein